MRVGSQVPGSRNRNAAENPRFPPSFPTLSPQIFATLLAATQKSVSVRRKRRDVISGPGKVSLAQSLSAQCVLIILCIKITSLGIAPLLN